MSLIALMASSQAGTHVISPIVSQGEFELEAKFTRTFDKGNDEFDNAQAHALSFAYGVNSFWATEVELQWKKDADGGTRHFDSTSWENRFQLTPQGEYWADVGLFFEYEKVAAAEDHNAYTVGLLLRKDIGDTVTLANLLLNREIGFGGAPGVSTEIRVQTLWQLGPQFKPGFEVYYEPGQSGNFAPYNAQRLRVGPVVAGYVKTGTASKLKYELGYLFGLTSASEKGTLRARLEYEFR